MSFEITDEEVRSRIDRSYVYDDYWIWGFPDLKPPIDFSLVVHDGPDGFACFTQGQNSFFAEDPSVALGYADPYLTDYLIHQTHQFALPWLLQKFATDASKLQQSQIQDPITGMTYLAINHNDLGLAMLIDLTSHLPYAIRSEEYHIVFGNSTSDLVLSGWSEVDTGSQGAKVLLPHHFQTVYNSKSVLEDFLITSISVNSKLSDDFFDAHITGGDSDTSKKPSKPEQNPEYPRSEIHESFESGLWSGPFGDFAGVSDVVIENPIPGLKEIITLYIAYPDYVQLLVEFENGLLITDAPPHRSKIILDWVESNMNGKHITHVVPSHHHRDHAGGVDDYVSLLHTTRLHNNHIAY